MANRSPSLLGLDPASYCSHSLHRDDHTYQETNCYADALVELLNAHGCEPLAMLGFIVRTDWEGDQFTYFKPPPADLERLFGIDIHEMLIYKSLPEHIDEQLRHGRTVLLEVDAWYLPDTVATSYRREHLKTTVAPETIDREQEWMRYFHNAGLFELDGEDYRGALRTTGLPDKSMEPFIEVVNFDAGPRLQGAELRAAARELLAHHHARRPRTNPFTAWQGQLEAYLPQLLAGAPEDYHAYAFVTVRMVGAAFELLRDHITWLFGDDGSDAIEALTQIVDGSKVMSFRLARRRAFDPEPVVAGLAGAWDTSMAAIDRMLA